MFNFNKDRFVKVIKDALSIRFDLEKLIDNLYFRGFENLFLIGVGGTYAHFLPIKYMSETLSTMPVHVVQAAEFILQDNKHFSKNSLCVFCSRSGDTKEIVEAITFCNMAGATTLSFVCNPRTPVCELSKYHFVSFAEDDHLAECFYLVMYTVIFRLLKNRGEFVEYDKMFDQINSIAPYLVKAKEQSEEISKSLAKHHKNTDYHMVVGSGAVWGEAYDYAMCILEEMQWIKTKSIHAGEYFHGTIELTEENTSIILLYGEDATRPLMDRVYNFAIKISKEVTIFDTRTVELPVDEKFRQYLSPLVIYTMLERFSCHLEKERNHPLSTRRFYRQIQY